jgi:hypothetical protein
MFGSNSRRDIATLRNLPLESMLTSVMNAAIKAQAEAALTTAEFVKEIGFVASENADTPILDDDASAQKLKVRQAELSIETGDGTTKVTLPFISLFNIPSLEIDELDWSFKAELKSVESFRSNVKVSTQTTSSTSGSAGVTAPLGKIPIPIQLGSTMKVEVKQQADFEARGLSAREQKYSLNVKVRASSTAAPRGIERLFDIADRIITESTTTDGDDSDT